MTTATKNRPARSNPRNIVLNSIQEAARAIIQDVTVAKKPGFENNKEAANWLKHDVKELQQLIERLESMD